MNLVYLNSDKTFSLEALTPGEISERTKFDKESFTSALSKIPSGMPTKDYYLLKADHGFLLTHKKDVAGLRMMLLASSSPFLELDKHPCSALLIGLARDQKCNLIQFEIDPDETLTTLPHGYYISNFVFKRVLADEQPQAIGISPIPDFESFLKTTGPRIDFDVRWTMPGSTVALLDTFARVSEEYRDLPGLEKLGILGHAQDQGGGGHILWLKSKMTASAIVMIIYVKPHFRGHNLGSRLLEAAVSDCVRAGIKELIYFVSSHNLSAIQMLLKNNFRARGLVANRQL